MRIGFFLGFSLLLVVHFFLPAYAETGAPKSSLRQTIETLGSFGSRTTGSKGYEKTVTLVKKQLQALGLTPQDYFYEVPIRRFQGAQLRLGDNVVWRVDSVEDYLTVLRPFVAQARADGRRLVHVRFGQRDRWCRKAEGEQGHMPEMRLHDAEPLN